MKLSRPVASTQLRPEDLDHLKEIAAALPELAPDLRETPGNVLRVALRLAAQEVRARRERRDRLRAKLSRAAETPAASDAGVGASAP